MSAASGNGTATAKKKASAGPSHSSLGQQASKEAARRAAAVLEVLGGLRKPCQAAAALKVSVNHYYSLERKALAGLLAACEPRPKGPRGPGAERRLVLLQRELEDCQRECLRQAALVRATQRAVGLPATAPPKPSSRKQPKPGKKGTGKKAAGKRPRRPVVRALQAAQTLQKNSSGSDSADELEQPSSQKLASSGVAEKERQGDA